jgi:hypothetical protein
MGQLAREARTVANEPVERDEKTCSACMRRIHQLAERCPHCRAIQPGSRAARSKKVLIGVAAIVLVLVIVALAQRSMKKSMDDGAHRADCQAAEIMHDPSCG